MTKRHPYDVDKRPEAIQSQHFLHHIGNISQCIDQLFYSYGTKDRSYLL